MRKFQNNGAGFTLMEILVAVFIFSSIIGLVIYFSLDIFDYSSFISDSAVLQSELQLTLNSMETEIRSMGQSNIGGYPIAMATSSSLIFYSDNDRDGLFERIRYFLSGNTFMRGVTKPTGNPLSYNPADEKTIEAVHYVITSPANIFSYYGKMTSVPGLPLAFPISINKIRAVKVDLAADRNPNALPGPVIYSIFSTMRFARINQ